MRSAVRRGCAVIKGLTERNALRMSDSLRMSEIRRKGAYTDVDRDGIYSEGQLRGTLKILSRGRRKLAAFPRVCRGAKSTV